jgi:cellulose synthase/poly-beta-1,6-N-acetylglucosamine synthase-like glycosyltransferase
MGQTGNLTVSVIVPVYNGERELPALLTGLANQTYPRSQVEYLLVDNGSRDRTCEVLQTEIARYAPDGLVMKYLCETQIQSSYAARNAGIKAATGAILAFTDADCRPQPTWLAELLKPFADPQVGLVAGEVLALPGDTIWEAYAERHNTLSQTHTLSHPFLPYGQTANLAVRCTCLQAAGLFRPYLTTGGDADLCWRILQLGTWQIRFADQAIVRHQHRTSLAELRKQWRRYGRSNRYLHELHGVELAREPGWRDYGYRLGRWLLKELPQTLVQQIQGKATADQLLDTPLDLLCIQARAAGQRWAVLEERAREVARFGE